MFCNPIILGPMPQLRRVALAHHFWGGGLLAMRGTALTGLRAPARRAREQPVRAARARPGGRGPGPARPPAPPAAARWWRAEEAARPPPPRPPEGPPPAAAGLSPPHGRRAMGARPQPPAQGYDAGRAPPLSLAAGMPKLSKEAKQRLQQLFKGSQFAIRWGFIPVVLYLGFRRGADPGMPEPTILSLLWG
uniref:Mitochondrial import receptor subunit TOM7 homolog n=1 Tax=Apteryx owenii TaxID=8824 RepID=A0A8B9P794_APTOW